MQRILVTGGAGFIGSNFVRFALERWPEARVTNLDALTYAGTLSSLEQVTSNPRYGFVHGDIADPKVVRPIFEAGVDVVVNFAAESHVDRSIKDPGVFVRTNVLGTQVLLDYAREFGVTKFVQISTDEVYGSLGPEGYFTENTPLAPSSPYSASKASADMLALAYHHTFDLPVNVTRCSNNYGPFQFPEKLIPFFVARATDRLPLPLYGDGLNIRDWLHVLDHCRAIALVIEQGRDGEVYNIGGHNERTNKAITHEILRFVGRPVDLIMYVGDRSGHDRRYAIDSSKIQSELGWKPKYTFEVGLAETVAWYQRNERWWRPLVK